MAYNQKFLFSKIETGVSDVDINNVATFKGIAFKTLLLLALTITSGIVASILLLEGYSGVILSLVVVSSVVCLITGIVGMSCRGASLVCSIIYALFQGILLGTLTLYVEVLYPGISTTAIIGTITVFAVTLGFYIVSGGISAGFKRFLVIALISTVAVELIMGIGYMLDLAPMVAYFNSPLCIIGSIILVLFAALFLLPSFQTCVNIVAAGCEKRNEWTAAFGLLVSILWIYIEILRLLVRIAASSAKR